MLIMLSTALVERNVRANVRMTTPSGPTVMV
jgi:hypothetical protein